MKVNVSLEEDPTVPMEGWLKSHGSHLTINNVVVTDFQLDIQKTAMSDFLFRNAFSGEIKNITINGTSFQNFEFIAKDAEKFILLQRRYQTI